MKKFLLSSLFFGLCANGMPPGKTQREEFQDQVSKSHRPESVSAAADMAGMKTPERSTLNSDFQTPGQKLAIEQMSVNKTEFDKAFGSELVDSWNIDWDCFKETLSFDHPRRRNSLRRIDEKLGKMETEHKLRFHINNLVRRIQGIYTTHLEETCKAEIRKLRHDIAASPKLNEKSNGVQLGCKVNLQLEDESILKYHVKTHSAGRLEASPGTAPKIIDPIELFVYKILEHLGIGCECHFFGYSKEDFYIATLDAGTNGEFHEFEYFQKNKEEGTKLWGEKLDEIVKRYKIINSNGTASFKSEEAEEFVKDDFLAHEFIFELTKVDYVCRMLYLYDVLNNAGNFGFIEKGGKKEIKAIDFRLGDKNKWEIDLNAPLSKEEIEKNLREILSGFKTGNGQYRYTAMNPPGAFALHYRCANARFKTMEQVVDFYSDILEKIELTYQDISQVLDQAMFEEIREDMKEQLAEFKTSIVYNITWFNQKVRDWKPVIKESSSS